MQVRGRDELNPKLNEAAHCEWTRPATIQENYATNRRKLQDNIVMHEDTKRTKQSINAIEDQPIKDDKWDLANHEA